ADFMRQALPPPDGTSFPEPSESYLTYRICNLDGRIAGPDCPDSDTYYFQPGQVPPGILPETPAVAGDARLSSGEVAPEGPAAPHSASAPATPPAAAPRSGALGQAAAAAFSERLRDAFSSQPRSVPPE
ncbi:MAG TPA: hypothetical protein VL359_03535, partial [bacterium]|nr:hypothetical protein [bacterium]